MKLVVIGKNNKIEFNQILEVLLYIVGYTFSFLIVSRMFNSFLLSKEYTVVYALISVILIYLLNKTVKPILFVFTIPITGLTLGLFYFVLNTVILKIVDLLMGSKLDFTNIWILFFISIIISIINLLIELIIIKPIVKRVKIRE